MKKRSFGYSRWRWRSGGYVLLGFALLIVALLKLQGFMGDASREHRLRLGNYADGVARDPLKPKLAFLFLARHVMPLDILWDNFFEGAQEGDFNVYLHARPGFVYTRENTKCRAFVDRQVETTIQVVWGGATMIQAERLLLTEALEDPLNERFFLLSDSCIPLYNFNYVYDYVMSSPKSFLDSFVDYSDEQYNTNMETVIPPEKWRKGSQWFVLTRNHAQALVEDSKVFPVFVDFCKKYVTPENCTREALKKGAKRPPDCLPDGAKKPHSCIPDEHYIQTMFAMEELETQTERRTLTYSRWEKKVKGKGREGWHPATYTFSDATLEAVRDIQKIRSIRYETESRTEWCKVAGKDRPCFLFARKFTRAAGFRLLDQASSYENGLPEPS